MGVPLDAIHQQVRDVLTYLKNVILKEYVRKLPDQAEAIRYFNYPYVALEESIVNAMHHRGYDILSQVCPRSVPGQTAASVILKARDSIDMATLMLTLNQKNRTRFRNQLINPLIKTGLIELTIPDKPTSSKQRYKTTIKGLKIIDEIKKKKT
jgi:ATP-dependent DNA helicase RecG